MGSAAVFDEKLEHLNWNNPIAHSLYQDDQFRCFLKRCVNEVNVAFEASFVLTSIYVGGFIKPGFEFSELLASHLCYPKDDLQFNLRLLYFYQRKGEKWFGEFAKQWHLDTDSFYAAIGAAKELSVLYKEILANDPTPHKQIGHLNEMESHRRIQRMQAIFVDIYIDKNVAVYTELEATDSTTVFFNPSRKVYFKISKSSVVNYISGQPKSLQMIFHELQWLNSARQQHPQMLKAAVTHYAKFMVVIPYCLLLRVDISKLSNEKERFVCGPLLANRLIKCESEQKLEIANVPVFHFYKYDAQNYRLRAICVKEGINALEEFIYKQAKLLSEELKDEELHFFTIHEQQITVILGSGFSILGFTGTLFQDDDNSNSNIYGNRNKFIFLQNKYADKITQFEELEKEKDFSEPSSSTRDVAETHIEDKCPICLNVPSKSIRNPICGHLTCAGCLINFIASTQPQDFPIRCITANCRSLVPLSTIDAALSEQFECRIKLNNWLQGVIERWLDYYLRFNRDGYRRCRADDCGVVFYIKKLNKEDVSEPSSSGASFSGSEGPQSKTRHQFDLHKIFCKRCQSDRCSDCGYVFHEGLTCQQYYYEKLVPDSMKQWQRESPDNRRFCPTVNCHMPVEKTEGCNHMKCEKCGVEFCWLCENYTSPNPARIYKHLREFHGYIGTDFFADDIEYVYE